MMEGGYNEIGRDDGGFRDFLVDLYCVDAIIPLNRATMRFRWPACEEVNLCWRAKRHSVHQFQSPK
jgi:hypothetical protein